MIESDSQSITESGASCAATGSPAVTAIAKSRLRRIQLNRPHNIVLFRAQIAEIGVPDQAESAEHDQNQKESQQTAHLCLPASAARISGAPVTFITGIRRKITPFRTPGQR